MTFLDDYEPVEDRLREFHSANPGARVLTELVKHGTEPGDVLVFRCDLYQNRDDDRPVASGYAHQRLLAEPPPGRSGKPNYSAPEWTSPWEVAETSAIGRALANLGYATKGKRPSREEVSKAQAVAKPSGAGGVVAPAPDPTPEPTPEPIVGVVAAEPTEGEAPAATAPASTTQALALHAQLAALCEEAGLPVVATYIKTTGKSITARDLREGRAPVELLEKAIGAVSAAILAGKP